MAISTLPEPIADALSKIVAHGTVEVAVHGQLETFAVTLTPVAIRSVPELSRLLPIDEKTL
jgi:hypothetical protein